MENTSTEIKKNKKIKFDFKDSKNDTGRKKR